MFNDRESVGPILISMFLGLLVVLLVGGFVLNLVGNYRNAREQRASQVSSISTSQERSADGLTFAKPVAPKKGLLQQLKEKFAAMRKPKTEDKAGVVNITGIPSNAPITQAPQANQTTMFIELVSTSGLSQLSENKGEVFTTFMPYDQAFVQSKQSLDQLKAQKNQNAIQILVKRHIVLGSVNGGAVKTLSGDTVNVDFTKNTVTYNGVVARIIETRGNTIIIDKVLY